MRLGYSPVQAKAYDSMVLAAVAGGAFDPRRNPKANDLRLWDWVVLVDRAAHAGECAPGCADVARRWRVSRSVVSRFMKANLDAAQALSASLRMKWVHTQGTRSAHADNTLAARQVHAPIPEEAGETALTATAEHVGHTQGATTPHAGVHHARIETTPTPTPTPTPTQEEPTPTASDAPAPEAPVGALFGVPEGPQLTDRARKALHAHGLRTRADLTAHSRASLRKLKGIGDATIAQVEAWLNHHGDALKPDPVSPGQRALRVRQLWDVAFHEATGATYIHGRGDIHSTSPHLAEAFNLPEGTDQLDKAMRAYIAAAVARQVWPHNQTGEPPKLGVFANNPMQWVGVKTRDETTPAERLARERQQLEAANRRRFRPRGKLRICPPPTINGEHP